LGKGGSVIHNFAALSPLKIKMGPYQQARLIRDEHAINTVTFSGGVFQNRVLTEQAMALLETDDFHVCLPELIPVNDAGISFGQIIEFGYK